MTRRIEFVWGSNAPALPVREQFAKSFGVKPISEREQQFVFPELEAEVFGLVLIAVQGFELVRRAGHNARDVLIAVEHFMDER